MKRSTKFYRKNEAEVMKRLGLKPTKNSGAGWIEKEDGQNNTHICQLKSTDAQSISIKQKDIRMLEYNASNAHKTPVFAFQFLNTGEVWVALPESEFRAYMDVLGQRESVGQIQENIIDIEQEEEYNNNVSGKNLGKSYLARQSYQKQMQQEKEQKERENRERRKKKNWIRNSNRKE